jgi:hypothetical protein
MSEARNFTRCTALLALLITTAGHARADEVSPDKSVAAQALFDEAKRLMQKGDATAACPKFEESEKLEPGIGTKLNLASCYEHVGRTASAWVLYLEVESETRRNGQIERQTMAHDRAAALEPKLSHVTVEVPAASRAPGLVVERDGVPIGSAQWGLSIPVDPGVHVVRALAPEKQAWQSNVSVAADASAQTVTIPLLQNRAALPSTLQPAPPADRAQRNAAIVGLSLGGVGVLVGTVFGLRAVSKNNSSNEDGRCQGNACTQDGVTLRNQARTAGTVSTVAFAIGGAALATGFILLLTDSKRETPSQARLSFDAVATRDGAALGLRGTW